MTYSKGTMQSAVIDGSSAQFLKILKLLRGEFWSSLIFDMHASTFNLSEKTCRFLLYINYADAFLCQANQVKWEL